MSLIRELKRRNVFRVAVAYAVISWLLIQVADTLTPALRLPDWIVSAIALVLLLGFIPTMLFSWAYEITPEGIKKEIDVKRDQSVTATTAKKLDIITLIAILGLGGLIVWQQLNPAVAIQPNVDDENVSNVVAPQKTAAKPLEKSIAVLPFADMSPKKDQEYFADGISEEILNALVKATGLRVAGRTSSFSFKNKDATINEIGKALNVEHVLEGSVRKHNNSVRITAQLIQVDDGFHLWSKTYNGSLENIFELQDQISRQVTKELKIILNLSPTERLASKMTSNIDAYDYYLRGREKIAKRVDGNLEQGMELLQQAIKLDPDFAEAWASLAEAEAVSVGYLTQTEQQTLDSDKRAMEYARNAIVLNEKLALPYAVLGLTHLGNNDILKSIEKYNQALVLEPNNTLALRWLGSTYSSIGRVDLAFPLYEKSYSLDPLSSINAYNMAASYFTLKKPEKAIRFFTLTGDLRSRVMPQVSFIYEYQSKHQEARNWSRKFLAKEEALGNTDGLVSKEDFETLIIAEFGGTEEQKKKARELGTIYLKNGDDTHVWQLAHHLAIGNIDRVYEIFEQKPSLAGVFAPDYMWLPSKSMVEFRSDPRFIPLLIKNQIPIAWQTIGWPSFCQPSEGTDGSNGQFSCQ